MCNDRASVQTQDQKNNLQGGLSKTTSGAAGSYDPADIEKVLNFAKFLVGAIASGNQRRKRRSVQNVEVVVKTPAEVSQ